MTVDRRKELFPNVSDNEWNDWQWQVRNRIETVEQLKKYPLANKTPMEVFMWVANLQKMISN